MIRTFIPGKETYTDMSPEEFERVSLGFLKQQAGKLENSKFEHNVMMKAHDGNYQIDGKITFSYLGLSFVCLVECKKYSGPIEREKVASLYAKMQSLGAQKGILITTSYFQSGALLFAKEHGIALITITDEGMIYHQRGAGIQEIHRSINGSMFVPVLTEAITDTTYHVSYLHNKTCNGLVDFLRKQ